MSNETPCCIYCKRAADEAPLIAFQFKGENRWICAQHLPILIHKPAQLADRLPGMERVAPPTEGHH